MKEVQLSFFKRFIKQIKMFFVWLCMTHAMSKNLGRITLMDIYNPITNNKTNRNLNETGPNGRVTEF